MVTADKTKLQAILSEKGLPSKVGARLNPVEEKVHYLLCAAYNFRTGVVALEIPSHVLHRCGPEFAKLWSFRLPATPSGGKPDVLFYLTSHSIKTTVRTAMNKDSGIFSASKGTVQLAESWSRFLKPRDNSKQTAPNVDWSRAARAAERHNRQVTEDIMEGKTFNAQKDNPWARKNLKNRQQ